MHLNQVVMSLLMNQNAEGDRNTGLEIAKDNCITFDSDDKVNLGVLTVLKRMEKDDMDKNTKDTILY